MPRLNNWSLVHNWNPYRAPECVTVQLHGLLFTEHDDKSLEVGRIIVTSNLVSLDLEGKRAVTKSGTVYELGEAKEDSLGGLSVETLNFHFRTQASEDILKL